jgi:hypothetical protein
MHGRLAVRPVRVLIPLAAVAALVVTSLLVPAQAAPTVRAAQAPCSPFTEPTWGGDVPTPTDVLGFPLGQREVTVKQSDDYLLAVAAASDRVSAGVLATSQQSRPLRYAVVGDPVDVRRAQAAARELRSPRTSAARAAVLARTAPAIAWIAGNVHGNEESGTDAALRVLHGLADRTDCAAEAIRDNTVTVILPTQNPDGREADTRRNAYGFDMNRDWFARTQPETDGKLEMLRRMPPVLFIDDHEMGAENFFVPPNADPIYHEIPNRAVSWINNLYGSATASAFRSHDIPFFNYDIYDLLYMGYGDTVPTTGFLGAGMTFEKNNADPVDQRVNEQYVALWASLSALARSKEGVLTGWAGSYRQARNEGRDGQLEPNQVFAAGHTVELQVPDIKVRHYFLQPAVGSKADEVRAMVRRLQRMDVRVRRLTAPLGVPDYTPYGRAPRPVTMPAGTFWVTMAQAQKHWVQAMLNETTYVPFPYFYDVTAWSGPLLFNLAGGRSGALLSPRSESVAPLGAQPAPQRPARAQAVGLLTDDDGTSGDESTGWMRWLFEKKWRIPYRRLATSDLAEGGLAPITVLVVPDVDANAVYDGLGVAGRRSLRQWLANGGRLVTASGGTELAARLQLTTARLSTPTSDIPGSLVRAEVEPGPLSHDVGSTVWNFYAYDNVMRLADPQAVAVRYPSAISRTFFVSGFERGATELANTAAVGDETYGKGRVVVFASDPNFRAFTDGTQQVLWNAIYGADPRVRAKAPGAATRPVDERRRAAEDASRIVELDDRLVLTVRRDSAAEAVDALQSNGLPFVRQNVPGGVRLVARMRTSEESPVTRDLTADLKKLGPGLLAARLP